MSGEGHLAGPRWPGTWVRDRVAEQRARECKREPIEDDDMGGAIDV